MKATLIISLMIIMAIRCNAQSPYALVAHTDVPITGFGAVTLSYSILLHKNHPILTELQVSAIDTTLLGIFDLPTIHYNNKTADRISSAMLAFSFASFAVPVLDANMRQDYFTYFVMNAETLLNGIGAYGSFKNTVNRPRPYLCSPRDSTCVRISRGATSSFPSGHVTVTACNTFYTAKIINDNSNNLALKIGAWSTAAVYPAIVGYLRVKSGKHYPTDVIAGYFIGAATGILVANIHQRFNKVN